MEMANYRAKHFDNKCRLVGILRYLILHSTRSQTHSITLIYISGIPTQIITDNEKKKKKKSWI